MYALLFIDGRPWLRGLIKKPYAACAPQVFPSVSSFLEFSLLLEDPLQHVKHRYTDTVDKIMGKVETVSPLLTASEAKSQQGKYRTSGIDVVSATLRPAVEQLQAVQNVVEAARATMLQLSLGRWTGCKRGKPWMS